MTLAEMDALRSLSFPQLRVRAAEVGVPEAKREQAVTCDELRLAVVVAIVVRDALGLPRHVGSASRR